MTTNFPSSIDNFTNPTSSSTMASPSHSAQHADVNDAVEALQAKVGVDGSAVTTSLDYKVANQGLTFIKSQTIGSGVTSVTVTDAFSSTFDNYYILLTGTTPSVSSYFTMSFSSGHTSGYYGRYKSENYLGTVDNQNRNNAGNLYVGFASNVLGASSASVTVCSPYISGSRKSFFGNAGIGPGLSIYGGETLNNAAYSAFYMTVTAGTMTGGTIRVYGYNNG